MKLSIKKIAEEIKISYKNGNRSISINTGEDAKENNDSWNTKDINTFLIELSSSLPLEEKIEVEVSTDSTHEEGDLMFAHVVNLFKSFADEYNKEINE